MSPSEICGKGPVTDYGQIRWDSRVLGSARKVCDFNDKKFDAYGIATALSIVQHREFAYLEDVRKHLLGIYDTMTCSLSLTSGSEKSPMFLFQQDRTDFERMIAEMTRIGNALVSNYPKYCQALVLREIL